MTRAPEAGMPTLTFGDVDKVPRSHARLALLILEGYAYLLLIIAVFGAALGLLVWGVLARRPLLALVALGIGVPLLNTTTRAVRSLFFRLPVPRGMPVSAADAPRLHEMVEELRRKVQAPRVHRLLIGNSFNASAVQIARGGFFRPRNTLDACDTPRPQGVHGARDDARARARPPREGAQAGTSPAADTQSALPGAPDAGSRIPWGCAGARLLVETAVPAPAAGVLGSGGTPAGISRGSLRRERRRQRGRQ